MMPGAMFGPGGPPGMRMLRSDHALAKQPVTPGTAKRMLSFAAPYRKILVVFLFVMILDAAVGASVPLLYRQIINAGILRHSESTVLTYSGLVAAAAVAVAGMSIVIRWISAKVGEGLIFDLRSHVFEHVQRMPVAFFTRTQTGALVTRFNNDILGAQRAFTDTLSSVVTNLVTVVLVVAAMAVLSWQITLVALGALPLFVLPARALGRRLSSITRESYGLNAEMNNLMTERFNAAGALLVKLFGHPKRELETFRSKAARVRDIGITQAMYARVFFVALILVASLATALVYGWGGTMAVRGALSVGTVVALSSYLNRLYGPLTALSNVQVDVMTALVSFDRVFEVLDLPPMFDESPDAVPIPAGPAEVVFDHVNFHYPSASEVSLASLESVASLETTTSRQVLHDVTFTIPAGQMAALVGPSGAGKTTISYLLPRIYDADEGAVRIAGLDVRKATWASIADRVGMVTQDPHMFHDTIRANLAYARPEASEAEMMETVRGAQLANLVESLPEGLDTVVGDRGYRLSGGEKQRLAVARLLLKAPDVVVLDEATAHLDSESEAALQQALKMALSGRTSLVIAHRLSTVRQADVILVVDQGRIVERGTHLELLARGGLYSDLYRIQFEGQSDHDSTPERSRL